MNISAGETPVSRLSHEGLESTLPKLSDLCCISGQTSPTTVGPGGPTHLRFRAQNPNPNRNPKHTKDGGKGPKVFAGSEPSARYT